MGYQAPTVPPAQYDAPSQRVAPSHYSRESNVVIIGDFAEINRAARRISRHALGDDGPVAKPKCEYCQGRGRIWPLVSKPPIPCPQCLGEGVTNANG